MYQDDIDPDILEAATLVENEYQEFFKKKLEEYGVKSPAELDYDKSQEFFNEIKKEWHGVNESEECECSDDELNEGVEDVYASTYNQLVNPTTLGVGDVVSFPYSGYDTEFKVELIVNPSCFGMPTIYHLKALNGPCEGCELSFNEEYVQQAIQNKNEIGEFDDEMDKIVEALNSGEKFESQISEDDEEIDIYDDECENMDDEQLNESENKEQLDEATDFDITKESDKMLEKILTSFLKDKALDGQDYEIISRGNKLLLRVYNKKYIKDVENLLKGE